MPSPATDADSENPARLISDAPPAAGRSARRRRLWPVAALVVAVPLLLTLAGALTSPPHVKGVPVGHLVYLEADEPSEHTTLLRGLRLLGPDGGSREVLHEFEAQDADTGDREWITQPKVSPNGQWAAYEKQIITILDEKQTIDDQLWVVPLVGPNPQPKMLLDLTELRLKRFVGLAWSDDSGDVLFLNDGTLYDVGATGSPGAYTRKPLPGCPPLRLSPGVSATSDPSTDIRDYRAITPTGPRVISDGHDAGDPETVSVSPDGRQTAFLPAGGHAVVVHSNGVAQTVPVRWGWSVFGKRRITALRWSPDGKFLAYSVSKPPFEDELFYVNLTTGRCFQLPVRTGSAGWDWGP